MINHNQTRTWEINSRGVIVGRSELPVDPTQGPLQRFAAELQSLRREAGEPTYRTMSRTAGMSPSALSQAAKGNRLPTLQATLAFVRACGGDGAAERRWRERWEQVREEMARNPAPTPPATRRPEPPVTSTAVPGESRHGAPDGQIAVRPRGRAFRPVAMPTAATLAVALVGLFTAMSAGLLTFSTSSGKTTSVPAVRPIEDGQDPYIDGCGHDQRPVERQPIYRADGTHYGWIVLFVSPACSAAWGYVLGPNSPRWRVYVSAHRMDDDAEVRSSFQGQARPNSWGDALSTRAGCVRAEAWVDDGPRAVTSCWRQNGPVVRGGAGSAGPSKR